MGTLLRDVCVNGQALRRDQFQDCFSYVQQVGTSPAPASTAGVWGDADASPSRRATLCSATSQRARRSAIQRCWPSAVAPPATSRRR